MGLIDIRNLKIPALPKAAWVIISIGLTVGVVLICLALLYYGPIAFAEMLRALRSASAK